MRDVFWNWQPIPANVVEIDRQVTHNSDLIKNEEQATRFRTATLAVHLPVLSSKHLQPSEVPTNTRYVSHTNSSS